jgi:tetratricopeptide (TPR) repeat protein
MNRSTMRRILGAAAAAVLFANGLSFAQQRVGDDGRALDANNRVGSGGYNSGPIRDTLRLNPNNIVTGNVTGGREFRGHVPYTDPREFRGGVAGEDFDRFIARSAGSPQSYAAENVNGQVEPFYGRRLATPPPQGFAQYGSTGTYVGTQQIAPSSAGLGPMNGLLLDNRISPRPADLMMPGPIDPQTNLPTYLSASPLLGIRQWRATDPADREYIRSYSSVREDNALDRLRLDPLMLRQMYDEITIQVDPNTGEKVENRLPGNISGALQRPYETPQNDPLGQRIQSTPINEQPLAGNVRATGSSYNRVLLPPHKQSAQYAELERRLRRYYEERLQTDEERNREFLKQLRARGAADQAAPATDPLTGGPALTNQNQTSLSGVALPDYARIGQELANQKPGLGTTGAPTAPGSVGGFAVKPKPMQITSLATGVQAPGLAKLLKTAEDLSKEGKFGPALEQYQAAAQLAPNNALVLVGLATAELTGGYYRSAEQHLRTAMRGDPVVLMAQFDLKAMLGQEKLESIVKDLKDIAFKQEKDAGVPLLLAFIAYNTGNAEGATIYLDLADKRSEGRDPLPRLLRQHWDIPAAPATRPVNVP